MAQRVILALGSDDPHRPEWATEEIPHVLDTTDHHFSDGAMSSPCRSSSMAIVGGGLSAVHLALSSIDQSSNTNHNCTVHIISRHAPRIQQFDTHQDYMMDQTAITASVTAGGSGQPKRQTTFAALSTWEERRALISTGSASGTYTVARRGYIHRDENYTAFIHS